MFIYALVLWEWQCRYTGLAQPRAIVSSAVYTIMHKLPIAVLDVVNGIDNDSIWISFGKLAYELYLWCCGTVVGRIFSLEFCLMFPDTMKYRRYLFHLFK